MFLRSLERYRDLGLLILRVGIGLAFAFKHGLPKIMGGPERWEGLGGAMGNLGVTFLPVVWGFMAALSEFGGGLLLILGYQTRLASAFLAFTMFVAFLSHWSRDGILSGAHPFEMMVVFIGLMFLGPGRHSADRG
jgi:putative oxidoreductase